MPSAILGVALVGVQKYGGPKGWEALGISPPWSGASLPIPSDLSSPQPLCTVLWTPGRARPVCPLIFLKLRGALVTSQRSLCKQFGNSRLGQPSQTGSPQESIAYAPWTPVAGFALEHVSKVPGMTVVSKLAPKDPSVSFSTEPETTL